MTRPNAIAIAVIAASSLACALEDLVAPTTPPDSPSNSTQVIINASPFPTLIPASGTPETPTLRRLTEAGCCAQPYWSADGQWVLFIDKPTADAPSGVYGVNIDSGDIRLVDERVTVPSPDGRYRQFLDDGQLVVEEAASGTQFIIQNEGHFVHFSPNSQRLVWSIADEAPTFAEMVVHVTISAIDGSGATELATTYGGGVIGWLDDSRLLLAGRAEPGVPDVTIFDLDVSTGARLDLVTERRMRNFLIAPGGEWIAYAITLHPDDPAQNGLWLVKADGSERHKLTVFGGFLWRDSTHLLVMPFAPGAASDMLVAVDAVSRSETPATDPALLPFRVSVGQWSVSPTGRHVVIVSAGDLSLWLITLPPG